METQFENFCSEKKEVGMKCPWTQFKTRGGRSQGSGSKARLNSWHVGRKPLA